MPKAIVIDPSEKRKHSILQLGDIPINQYQANAAAELKRYGPERLRRVLADMLLVREFETMLQLIKTQGSYQGIEYNHLGPAHLSIGQESLVVGQCLALKVEDFIFGSHRSHGEILAKCCAAIQELSDERLLELMKGYFGGALLKVVEKDAKGSVKDLAMDFMLYGVLAEIFGRANGFNQGMGGSMHAFFAPFGSMPNNAIVGGSADIAVGSALFKRINRQPGIVIANIGDASSACGPTWEALCLASMDQYRTLWDPKLGGAPPMVFNFINNFYGMGGQPEGETMGFGMLARIGAGVNPDRLHAERVDGYNPLAVADAFSRKKEICLAGKGPVLLDTITYRFSGHSPSDASSYRTKEEVELWKQQDCIAGYTSYLQAQKLLSDSELEAMQASVTSLVTKALRLAASLEISPGSHQ
jgi:2-oxoisovalerate dehydrogenase E1 component